MYVRLHVYTCLTLPCVLCPQSTVRVPAPSHYAHRLAFLVGQSLHQQHNLKLANELFFL